MSADRTLRGITPITALALLDEAEKFITGFASAAESGFVRRQRALDWLARYKALGDPAQFSVEEEEQLRQQFEQWVKPAIGSHFEYHMHFMRGPDGVTYSHPTTHTCWWAWKAASLRQLERIRHLEAQLAEPQPTCATTSGEPRCKDYPRCPCGEVKP